MEKEQINQLLDKQRQYFYSGATLDLDFRISALKRLRASIRKHEDQIHAALKKDLGKSNFESYMCETGLVLSEITHMLKNIRSYAKEQTVPTPLAQFHSRSFRKPSPYGVVLIMSPWNYPFLLTIEPLVDAIAAGNTVILKPSAYSPATSEVIRLLIHECFDEKYVATVTGGRAENTHLLSLHFDYIFFTGSQSVGKEVMRKASEHLTPVTLELGGKSPCIVDKTANLRLAAKRIVFGKFLNCGQTCVAPDYIYCDPEIKEALVAELRRQITRQYGKEALKNRNYGKIINEKHFERILGLINGEKLVYGGQSEPESLRIAPTVLNNITWDDAVMGEEIFGPLLPILTFDTLDEALDTVESHPHPLALYFFSEDKAAQKKVLDTCRFGGGCINDTIIHLATSDMPFGGVGESGMGSYHGRVGFETFSHYRSIVDKKTWMDLPIRYQKYTGLKEKMMRMFLK